MISKVWVRAGGGLTGLRPVMENWVARSMDYCRSHGFEDNSWWYNERASLSVLAAAAWASKGWCALEEYATTKQGVIPAGEADSGRVKSGRCDLWLGNRTGYALEAKQAWQSIGPGATGKNPNIWRQFESARRDAGALTVDEANKRVAGVFVVPYIPVAKVSSGSKAPRIDGAKAQELVTEWLKDLTLSSNRKVGAYAWVFPRKNEKFISANGRNFFPGAMLILGERKRANRRRAVAER